MQPTEQQILATLDQITPVLVAKWSRKFVGLCIDDLKSEIALSVLRAIRKGTYDPKRSLASYAFVSADNALKNRLRDTCFRNDPPCRACHDGRPCNEGQECHAYMRWRRRQQAKSNLNQPLPIDWIDDTHEPSMRHSMRPDRMAEGSDITRLIDRELPLKLRRDYLLLLQGESVPKKRRLQIREAVVGILVHAGLEAKDVGLNEDAFDEVLDECQARAA